MLLDIGGYSIDGCCWCEPSVADALDEVIGYDDAGCLPSAISEKHPLLAFTVRSGWLLRCRTDEHM